MIDKEINRFLQESYERAKDILTKHKVLFNIFAYGISVTDLAYSMVCSFWAGVNLQMGNQKIKGTEINVDGSGIYGLLKPKFRDSSFSLKNLFFLFQFFYLL